MMFVDECLSFRLIILPVNCSVWGPLLPCVHCVSSFSSCWKEFRSWPSPLVFCFFQLHPAVFFLLLGHGSWENWSWVFCKTVWDFFLCQGVFFKDILPYSGKLWVRWWAASVVRWLRPCLGLVPKEQVCISLSQSDLAASISRTLLSLRASPLPPMHFPHQSLKLQP